MFLCAFSDIFKEKGKSDYTIYLFWEIVELF